MPVKNRLEQLFQIVFSLFVGAQVLIPLISIALFQSRYVYPFEVIGYHLVLTCAAFFTLYGIAAGVAATGRIKIAGWLLSFSWGCIAVVLYFSYLMAWEGRKGMGVNLTVSMLAPYIKPPFPLAKSLGLTPAACWAILFGGPVAILLTYAAAVRAFATVLSDTVAWMHRQGRPNLPGRHRFRPLVWATGACIAGAMAVAISPPRGPVSRLFGDPILVTLVDENDVLPLLSSSIRSDDARASYKAPGQFERKNVILIVIDACRADHLGVMGYERHNTPFLESLNATGNLHAVSSFYSASCCTFGGVLSLLRSQDYSKCHGALLRSRMSSRGRGIPSISF